jgi:hypothetical protein
MNGAFASAWTMLRRRTVAWPAFAAITLFSAISIILTFTTAAAPGGSRFADPPTTLADLAQAEALTQFVGRPVMITGIVVLATAILHVAGQYSSGLIRVQFVLQPRRARWFAGNWLAIASAAAGASVLGAAVAVATAYACASIWRVDSSSWTQGLGLAFSAAVNLAVGMMAFALAGAALALWLRSAITALTVALVYALFENMINAVAPMGQGLLPASAFTTVATSGLNGYFYPTSLIATLVLSAAMVAGAFGLALSRDLTD